jgi:hypothetical protein
VGRRNPTCPASFDARSWTAQRFGGAARRLWTWDVPVIGPAIRSSSSGAQEEQFWTRGEPMLQAGAEWVLLFRALKLHGERPCNHLRSVASRWTSAGTFRRAC